MEKQENWQLLARPERLTELYFTDYRDLSRTFIPGGEQNLAFTVHNLEYRTTTYQYKLIAHSGDTAAKQIIGQGMFTLQHDRSQTTRQTVVVPSLGSKVTVKVSLEYEAIAFGDTAPRRQTQSINYWTKAAALPFDGGTHESA